MKAVQIEGVTKTFGAQVAVNDLSLEVPRGTIYGFLGPNGSGKTTTLRMLMRILYPDSGRIVVLGEERHGPANDRVGYLPEERGLYKRMKVRDVLRFHAALKGVRDTKQRTAYWLERMGLADRATSRVETLSKGMAQKIQFISAVIAQPELVLLDEPFSGLDPVNAEVMRDAILELKRDGVTVIFSTHDMTVAEQMCDFLFMIFKGKKVLDGTLAAIQSHYGKDTLRIGIDGGNGALADLPGVARVTDLGHVQELQLHPGADPQALLSHLLQRGPVRHFELTHPTLHEIFVRIAGPDAETRFHA